MVWAKLENPRPNGKCNLLKDYSQEETDLARLGKMALSSLQLSKGMGETKAKSDIRPHKRTGARLGEREGGPLWRRL